MFFFFFTMPPPPPLPTRLPPFDLAKPFPGPTLTHRFAKTLIVNDPGPALIRLIQMGWVQDLCLPPFAR